MNILLKNLSDSSEGRGGLLSEDDIRNAARALGDLSSSMKNNPGFDLATLNFLNATANQPDLTMQPLKLDFNDLNMGAQDFQNDQNLEDNFDDLQI
jgi:hypothetical protein